MLVHGANQVKCAEIALRTWPDYTEHFVRCGAQSLCMVWLKTQFLTYVGA